MDTDKIKIFGARVRVDGTGKLAELERAEKVCTTLLSLIHHFPAGAYIPRA
jgi:hypothetical protein